MRTRIALVAVVAVLTLAGTLACNEDRSSPTEPKQTATLTVELDAGCSGTLTAIDLALDGKAFGTVKPGETRDFEIPTGSHVVEITGQGGGPFTGARVDINASAHVHMGFRISCTTSGLNVEVH